MGLETLIFIYFLIWMLPCMIIAHAKNKNVTNAFFASLCFGLFALIYYIFVKSEPSEREKKGFSCPKCNAKISKNAKFCPKCGIKFKEEIVECPKCRTDNDKDDKFCSKCGYALFEEPEQEHRCRDCNKKFKSKEKLEKHFENCSIRKKNEERDEKIIVWGIGIVVFFGFGIIFTYINRINLVPLVLIGFILTPLFDKFFNKYKKKFKKIKHLKLNLLKKGLLIIGVTLLFILINLLIPNCPKSCDDKNICTEDFCSSETGYKCMNIVKLNCQGNGICEADEYGSSDCPDCSDGNKCTVDSYDYSAKKCINAEMKGCVAYP